MIYNPVEIQDKKEEWIKFLKELVPILDDRSEDKNDNGLLNGPNGDVADVKDLVGNFLALLTNKIVEIK